MRCDGENLDVLCRNEYNFDVCGRHPHGCAVHNKQGSADTSFLGMYSESVESRR